MRRAGAQPAGAPAFGPAHLSFAFFTRVRNYERPLAAKRYSRGGQSGQGCGSPSFSRSWVRARLSFLFTESMLVPSLAAISWLERPSSSRSEVMWA